MDDIISSSVPQKQCTKCKKWWPPTFEYFGKQSTVKSGLRSMCKVCNKEYDVTRATLKNERKKERRRSNPEVAERMRLIDRLSIRRHAKVISERKKNYYDLHPEQRRVEAHRRRARERNVGGKYIAKDIQDQFKRQKGKCYYCSNKLIKYHVDHIIPISRGGTNTKDNLVITCPSCNCSKHNKLPHEWPEGGRLL